MKKRFLFILLIVGIVLTSMSAISAMDNETIYSSEYIPQNEDIGDLIAIDDNTESKKSANLTVSDVEKYYNNGTNYNAVLTDDAGNPIANEKINITIKCPSYPNGVTYTRVTNNDGIAVLPIGLIVGDYSITTVYQGNELYDSIVVNSKITVLPTIIGGDLTKYYKNGTQYYVTLVNNKGVPLANSKVSFTVKGKTYTKNTNGNGVARLDINLSPGTYTIVTKNLADGMSRSDIIKVLPKTITEDFVKAYLDNHQFDVKLVNDNGNPLVNSKVSFTVKSSTYTKTTNSQGIATLPINLIPGTYTITIKNLADGTSYKNTVKVIKGVSTYIKPTTDKITAESADSIGAKLYDSLGYTVPNKVITLTINNKKLTATTDGNGVATFTPNIAEGSYQARYSFAGDNVFKTSSNTSDINVIKGKGVLLEVPETTMVKGQSKFTVIVKDDNGNAIPNIDVIFNIVGKDYVIKTNSQGMASLPINLNPQKTDITYTVIRDGYKTARGISTLHVIKSGKTCISNNNQNYYGKNQNIEFKLLADNAPVTNKEISIEINGKTFNGVTDSQGIASFNTGLDVGTYKVNCLFEGDSVFSESSNSFDIIINNAVKTKLEFVGAVSFVAKGGNLFSIKVTDSNNNPVVNRNVIFTISGGSIKTPVSYTKKTDASGVASLPINLLSGDYRIDFNFVDKTNHYLESSGTKTIKVKGFSIPLSTVIYINTDNIYGKTKDAKMLEDCAATLRSYGYKVVNTNHIGPNYHVYDLKNVLPAKSCYFSIFGGLCSGTFRDMASKYYQNILKSKNIVEICGFLSPPVKNDLDTLGWLPRSWDDNFSPSSFKGISNPGQYLKNNGFNYVYGSTGAELALNFINGGGGMSTLSK